MGWPCRFCPGLPPFASEHGYRRHFLQRHLNDVLDDTAAHEASPQPVAAEIQPRDAYIGDGGRTDVWETYLEAGFGGGDQGLSDGSGEEGGCGDAAEEMEGRTEVDTNAGRPIPIEDILDKLRETPTLRRQVRAAHQRSKNEAWPFDCHASFNLAIFIYVEARLSQRLTEKLIAILDQIPGYKSPFRNYQDLLAHIDLVPFQPPPFQEVKIIPSYTPNDLLDLLDDDDDPGDTNTTRGQRLPDSWQQPIYFRYRSIVDCVRHLLSRQDLAEDFDYAPRKVYNTKGERVISDAFTADWIVELQAQYPKGTLVAAGSFASDQTQLASMVSQRSAYPGYFTLCNIRNNIRKEARHHASLLLFLLPTLSVSEDHRNHKLWRPFHLRLLHECLRIVFQDVTAAERKTHLMLCPDGEIRRVGIAVSQWIADYKEATLIAMIYSGRCPICTVPRGRLGELTAWAPRNAAAANKRRREGMTKKVCQRLGIKDGPHFLGNSEAFDIHQCFCPDDLHQLLKPLRDHLLKWVIELLGSSKAEVFRRLELMPHFSGLHHFGDRGLDFAGWQGNHSQALLKILMVLVANASLSTHVVRYCRAYVNFVIGARRPKHTVGPGPTDDARKTTFAQLEESLEALRQHRDAAFGDVRQDFELPRHHSLVHTPPGIIAFGAAAGTSSEAPERQHIEDIKNPWRDSSRTFEVGQILANNDRRERLDYLGRLLVHVGDKELKQLASDVKCRKPRMSRNQKTIDAWTAGKMDFPVQLLASHPDGPKVTLRTIAKEEDESDLVAAAALFALHEKDSYATRRSINRSILDSIGSARAQKYRSLTVFWEPPDEIGDPTEGSIYLKSIIHATPSWSYRDTNDSSRRATSVCSTRHPRYDHVLYQAVPGSTFSTMAVGRAKLFFTMNIPLAFGGGEDIELAFLEEYDTTSWDALHGLWRLKPAFRQEAGRPVRKYRIVRTDSILAAAHVVPIFPKPTQPVHGVSRWDVYEHFSEFYLNHYVWASDHAVFDLVNGDR